MEKMRPLVAAGTKLVAANMGASQPLEGVVLSYFFPFNFALLPTKEQAHK